MKDFEDIIFKDGDTVFLSDDDSTHAFYISKGNVDLYRLGRKVYTASAGEYIGQSGVISGKKYGLTAKTVGPARIQKIEKNNFLAAMQNDPNVATSVVKNMSQQIYNNEKIKKIKPQSNDLTADINKLVDDFNYHKSSPISAKIPGKNLVLTSEYDSKSIVLHTPSLVEMSPAKKSFVSFLTSFITGVGSTLIDENPIKIIVPRIENDINNMFRDWIVSVIEPVARIEIIKPKEILSIQDENSGFIRSYDLISQNNADLAIWGGIDEEGRLLTLKFSSSIPSDDFMGNSAKNTLYIPLQGGDGLYSLLRAVALSSIHPKDDEHQEILQDILPIAIKEAESNFTASPIMANNEIISNKVSLGNCAYSYANSVGRDDFYRKAKFIYEGALADIIPSDDRNYFIVQKQLGQINQNISEKIENSNKNNDLKEKTEALKHIDEAINHFREAAEKTSREYNPSAWAQVQYSLAGSYQQRAMLEGVEEDFSLAISSYQSVLGVFSFEDQPVKWAEVMNSIGRTLQVYGEINKDLDALKRSIKMYRQALMVRSKDMYPLLWANTQNNLGAALFLMARHVKDKETLEKAIDSFLLAKDVYEESGAVKMSTIVQKNLVRAEDFKTEIR